MRRLALIPAVLLPLLVACGTTGRFEDQFPEPNSLMAKEIRNRIDQIPYQHREELFTNLLWLAQTGPQVIPDLLTSLEHEEPKVRSNVCWVLGRIRDRRVIPRLQPLVHDESPVVQLEAARTLMLLGDMQHAPLLIEALDADQVQVRYLSHEALKVSTGRDFGYDHLSEDMDQRHVSVLEWREWWSSMSGDSGFATAYAVEHGLAEPAATPGTPPDSSVAEPPAMPMFEGSRPAESPATDPEAGTVDPAPPVGQQNEQTVPMVPITPPMPGATGEGATGSTPPAEKPAIEQPSIEGWGLTPPSAAPPPAKSSPGPAVPPGGTGEGDAGSAWKRLFQKQSGGASETGSETGTKAGTGPSTETTTAPKKRS